MSRTVIGHSYFSPNSARKDNSQWIPFIGMTGNANTSVLALMSQLLPYRGYKSSGDAGGDGGGDVDDDDLIILG